MQESALAEWFLWLEEGSIATGIRRSTWIYPAIEIVHILGLVLVAGGALLYDFLLLKSRENNSDFSHLLNWSLRGLILVIPSGLFLFLTNASALSKDPVFHAKLILLLLAAVNALLYRRYVQRIATNERYRWLPKFTAMASIIFWCSVIACGRMLAY